MREAAALEPEGIGKSALGGVEINVLHRRCAYAKHLIPAIQRDYLLYRAHPWQTADQTRMGGTNGDTLLTGQIQLPHRCRLVFIHVPAVDNGVDDAGLDQHLVSIAGLPFLRRFDSELLRNARRSAVIEPSNGSPSRSPRLKYSARVSSSDSSFARSRYRHTGIFGSMGDSWPSSAPTYA